MSTMSISSLVQKPVEPQESSGNWSLSLSSDRSRESYSNLAKDFLTDGLGPMMLRLSRHIGTKSEGVPSGRRLEPCFPLWLSGQALTNSRARGCRARPARASGWEEGVWPENCSGEKGYLDNAGIPNNRYG